MTPRVTVLTATHDLAAYLPECLASVRAQTFPDWEQIVIDDGSTDETPDLMAKVTDPRVRYVRQERRGLERLAETYNAALGEARGDFVAVLDADDAWRPHALERLVAAMRDPAVGLAYGRTALVTANGRPTRHAVPAAAFERRNASALRNDPLGSAAVAMARPDGLTFTFPCATIVRAEVLRDIGGFQVVPGLPFTDYPTFLAFAMRTRFAFVPEELARWRQRAGSGTRTRDEVAVVRTLRNHALARLEAHAAKLGLSQETIRGCAAAWRGCEAEGWFTMGRRALRARRWGEARAAFHRARTDPDAKPRTRAKAALGLALSYAHRDLEPFARLVHGRDGDWRHLHATGERSP